MSLRARIGGLFTVLVGVNLGLWALASIVFRQYPVLLGTCFLAYSFGLRHAVDADHIAAIDNVTRKLMQQGKRPLGVGLFFSLGHSTIVVGLSVAIALTAAAIKGRFGVLADFGSVVGTLASALFLFTLAILNAVILRAVYRTFRRVAAGGVYADEDLNLLLARRGLLGRAFRGLFRLIDHSWQMYLVGVLFGLGFDTATEVGLLGIAATEASRGLPIWSILVFPALFAAGMALIDSADGVLMLGAYGWAFSRPLRKLFYNLTITAMSTLVALLIGGIESLGLLQSAFGLTGTFWRLITVLNDHFGSLGYAIIGIFAVGWGVSVAIYHQRRYDEITVQTK
jgi:high-affinity nickel-transport protein